MFKAKITGVASYTPDYILNNEELAQMVDTSDEWITTRVGIKERRILKQEGAGSSELGARALQSLIEKSGIKFNFDMLVIDELSSFKSHQTKRFHTLMKKRPLVKRIVGLTGTPSSNGLIDLWRSSNF